MTKSKPLAITGIVIVFIQVIISVMTMFRVVELDILPDRYRNLLLVCMILFLILVVVSQFFKYVNIAGKVLSVGLIAVFIYVYIAAGKVSNTLEEGLKKADTVQKAMNVIVSSDNQASSVAECKSYTFGISTDVLGYEHNKQTVELVNKELGTEIKVVEYADNFALAKALFNGEVGAMIVNSAFFSTIDDAYDALEEGDEGYLGKTGDGIKIVFSDKIKVLETFTITEEVKNTSGFAENDNSRELIDTTTTPFVVYISGIDVEGDISTTSRSDVNVLVAVNPITKQIAMVTTPRDAYVDIPGITDKSSLRDKLTHAGIYGTGCEYSIATLENIYGVNVDYYVRVNFTSVVDIVDLLGGIELYSAHDFTERWDFFHFNKGYNHVNGTQALHFARERYTIEGGDVSRGLNHIALVKAVLNKCMSKEILTNYSQLLDTVSKNIETNMTKEEITAIVKMQLDDGATWNYASAAAEMGNTSNFRYCYSYTGSKLWVSCITEESVAEAADLMERVLNGEIVEGDENQ